METVLSVVLLMAMFITCGYTVTVLMNLPHYTSHSIEELDKSGNKTGMSQKEYSEGLYIKALYMIVGGALLQSGAVCVAVMTLLYFLKH